MGIKYYAKKKLLEANEKLKEVETKEKELDCITRKRW